MLRVEDAKGLDEERREGAAAAVDSENAKKRSNEANDVLYNQ